LIRRAIGHLRAQWMGAVALGLVLAGGTAYAANEWTGANIVNESLTGADVRDDSIRGTDVAEGSLGKVADAGALDGLDSTSFLQGASAEAGLAPATGKSYFNRLHLEQPTGRAPTLIRIPGLIRMVANCSTAQDGSAAAQIEMYPLVDGLGISHQTSSGNPIYGTYSHGDSLAFSAWDGGNYRWSLLAGVGFNAAPGMRLASLELSGSANAHSCDFQGFALAQRN
jgi:hypothetical protein